MSVDVVCFIDDLDPAEAFLIRAFRNWAVGRRDGSIAAWVEVWGAFQVAMGDDGAPVGVNCFERVMAALAAAAQRTIFHHAPDCRCVGADETALVRLIAALAHDAPGEARLVALEMVRIAGVEPLVSAAGDLARALQRCDHVPTLRAVLRDPRGETAMPQPPRSRHLH